MRKKLRILASGLFSLTLAFSSLGFTNFVHAVEGPTLSSVMAKDTNDSDAKVEGDSVVFTFSEATNEFAVTEDNIDEIFVLNNSHKFASGDGDVGDIDWSNDGMKLTIELSDNGGLPTVAVGDTVTLTGDDIETDDDGTAFTGTVTISGGFITADDDEDEDEDEEECEDIDEDEDDDSDEDEDEDDVDASESDDDEDEDDDDCEDNSGNTNKVCNNALKNGKLYKIGDSPTVYLAVRHCTLKPFRGEAAFKARGHKFQDIIMLSAAPTGVTVSGEPALPAEGTLVKGSDKTVWFITHSGKRQGFVNADVFTKLGFKFTQVQTISDSDLSTMPADTTNISTETEHPDGSIVKCGNSPEVFRVKDGTRFPFPSIEVFKNRGHSFDHIANVDCGRFGYKAGPVLNEDSE